MSYIGDTLHEPAMVASCVPESAWNCQRKSDSLLPTRDYDLSFSGSFLYCAGSERHGTLVDRHTQAHDSPRVY